MADLEGMGLAQVGYGVADITPPIGTPLSGFASRLGAPSTGVDEPLRVQVLAFEDGVAEGEKKNAKPRGASPSQNSPSPSGQVHLLLSYDLLGIAGDLHAQLLADLVALDPARLHGDRCVLTASHTHSGPATCPLFGEAAPNPAYLADLRRATVDAARQALASLQPASFSSADWHLPGVTYNRRAVLAGGGVSMARTPDQPVLERGPLDDRLTVLLWRDADGAPIAAAVHFACHGTVQCTSQIGRDAPGVIADAVGQRLGAPCLYLSGAAGDVNPNYLAADRAALDDWRATVEASLDVLPVPLADGLRSVPWGPVRGATCQVPLPYPPPPSAAELDRIERGLHDLRGGTWHTADAAHVRRNTGMFPDAPPGGAPSTAPAPSSAPAATSHAWRSVLHTVDVLLASNRLQRDALAVHPAGFPTQPVRLDLLHLGPVALACVGAEVFASTGLALRSLSRPGLAVLPVDYASPQIGYIPDAEAHRHGGYEVAIAWRYYRALGPFTPDAADRLLSAHRALLASLSPPAPHAPSS